MSYQDVSCQKLQNCDKISEKAVDSFHTRCSWYEVQLFSC